MLPPTVVCVEEIPPPTVAAAFVAEQPPSGPVMPVLDPGRRRASVDPLRSCRGDRRAADRPGMAARRPSARTACWRPTPGPMTLDGTNTWVLLEPGSTEAVVIDPGPLDEGHLRRCCALVDGPGRAGGADAAHPRPPRPRRGARRGSPS